jgi:adenosylmethionine-8-amino-7-oxononanoate aminotransferase
LSIYEEAAMPEPVFVRAGDTSVFVRELDRPYPLIVKGEGVWLEDAGGTRYLDAVSGGAMVTSLGHGPNPAIAAAAEQAEAISFIYNQQFTSPAQEGLAEELTRLAPAGFDRVHFVTGGAEANETALRLARAYHVERGEPGRTRIVSPAQAYHGPTMATLGLTGRAGLRYPFDDLIAPQLHIPPSTWRFDPSGEAALEALDGVLADVGPGTIAAFFAEPVSAAALPGYSPPDAFWRGLGERRAEHGFLICLDEVVTGLGRTGTWFAAEQLPIEVDVITTAKGLGAGYAAIGAMLCRDHVYAAFEQGSRAFEHGHTWDGAPLPCAVGRSVLGQLADRGLVERVRERGPALRDELAAALEGCETVREVRGRGYLLGIDYVDPRDGESFLPEELGVARRIDTSALENGLIVYSTQPTSDGYAGDQTLLAPAFVATDDELGMVCERMAESVRAVERWVKERLTASAAAPA